MPISAKTFLRSNILLLAAGLVALLAIVVASVWLVGRTQAQVEGVLAVRQVRSAFADLRNLVQETETGQRGYLLTGEDSYLAPYTTSRSMVAPQIERLKTLVTPFPDLVEPTRELIGVIERKLAELDHTVDLHKSGRRDEALAILRDNSGQELMDRARALFDSLVTVADRKLVDHTESQNRSAAALRLVSMVGAAVILAVVGGSVWTVLRYTSDLAEARTTVEALNAGLEERVKERTVDLARANDEIQRFAYIVTHDLRAPLVNIMGFTSELEAGLEPIRGAGRQAGRGRRPAIDEAARTAARRGPARGDRLHPPLDAQDGRPDQRHPEDLARGTACAAAGAGGPRRADRQRRGRHPAPAGRGRRHHRRRRQAAGHLTAIGCRWSRCSATCWTTP